MTDQWKSHGVEEGREYAILTDEVTRAWSGMSTRQYKNLKGLKKENLRDNMSTLELALNMLAKLEQVSHCMTKIPWENVLIKEDGTRILDCEIIGKRIKK